MGVNEGFFFEVSVLIFINAWRKLPAPGTKGGLFFICVESRE